MVRTVKSHHEDDEEIEDEEFASVTPDISSRKSTSKVEGKNNDQKVNTLRSKHSETEQRRRSKINERFQVLRDLVPENDQKRDKASFLLEVIQYIQFLQEKIQTYEGTYQAWSPEPSKLIPWRSNSGSIENFVDQRHLVRNGLCHEDNTTVTSTLHTNSQNSIESDLSGGSLYRQTDHLPVAGNPEIPLNILVQPNFFDTVSAHPPQGSFADPDHMAFQTGSQLWPCKPRLSECAAARYDPNQQDHLKPQGGEASISNVYSHGLLNSLTHALESSGVDLSQTSISVQLDVGRRTNGGIATTPVPKDPSCFRQMAGYLSNIENYDHGNKKQKTNYT